MADEPLLVLSAREWRSRCEVTGVHVFRVLIVGLPADFMYQAAWCCFLIQLTSMSKAYTAFHGRSSILRRKRPAEAL